MAFSWVTLADDSPPCTTTDPEAFFPVEDDVVAVSYAKKICLNCDFVERCLTFALRDSSIQGIWGGTTTKERQRLRRGSNPRPTA